MIIIFLLCAILVPVLCARYVASDGDKTRVSQLFGAAGVMFLCLLWFIDDAIPFAGGGDDEDYFKASVVAFRSFSDWIDFSQFRQTHAQAGYPLILAWVQQVTGESLYARKALNVSFFLLLAVVWFAIGKIIGGRRMALLYARAMLLATPLWFYWMFLLKDMIIVLLQSLLILGLVNLLNKGQRVRGYILVALSTLLVIPFRSGLALVNIAALGFSSVLRSSTAGSSNRLFSKALILASIVIGVLVVGTRPDFLVSLGVLTKERALDIADIRRTMDFHDMIRPAYFANIAKFTAIYFLGGEVAIFNPRSWRGDGAILLRSGALVPWIYFGLPLFLVGANRIIRTPSNARVALTNVAISVRSALVDRSYLWIFIIFVVIYIGVSWLSGDTTRWRIASFPPMIAISAIGWMAMRPDRRFILLFIWGWLVSLAFLAFYMFFR